MFLKLADKLVKQGDYAGALNAIAKAREQEPENRYAIAYEERVRMLMHQSESKQSTPDRPTGSPPPQTPRAAFVGPARSFPDLPSVEGQLNAIATPMAHPGQKSKGTPGEFKNVVIMSKIASLLDSANEYLGRKEYGRALEVISRAALLDPTNADIQLIEKRIRAAQEGVVRREVENRHHREAEERQKRDRGFRAEKDDARHEQVQRRMEGEAARRSAQTEKGKEYLQRTRDFLAAGQIQEAQCELAFVAVIDPSNPEVVALEREIGARREEQQRAELENHRRMMEEQRRQEQAVRESVTQYVRQADTLAARGEFGEALRLVTRAYILDPTNGDLRACENRIVSAQKAWTERADAGRQTKEDAVQRKAEDEDKLRKETEGEKAQRGQRDQEEARKRADDQKIFRCMKNAYEHLAARRYKEALTEVSAALAIDPFHEDVKRMEKRIFEEQAKAAGTLPSQYVTPLSIDDEAVTATIAKHLTKAKRLAEQRHYAKALDEVSLALALDPTNVATRRIEATIKADAEKERREQAARNPLVTISQMAPGALRRANRSAVSQQAPTTNATGKSTGPGYQSTTRSQGRALPGMDAIDQLIKSELQQTIPAADITTDRRKSKNPVFLGAAVLTGLAVITVPYFITTADATQEPAPKAEPQKLENAPLEDSQSQPPQYNGKTAQPMKNQPGTKERDRTTGNQATRARSALMDGASPSGEQGDAAPATTEEGSAGDLRTTDEPALTPSGAAVEKSPQILKMQQPVFPDGLIKPGTEEEVIVKVQINPRGNPVQATVTRSTNESLNESVIDAVMHSQYSPGVLATGPATSWMTIPFTIKK